MELFFRNKVKNALAWKATKYFKPKTDSVTHESWPIFAIRACSPIIEYVSLLLAPSTTALNKYFQKICWIEIPVIDTGETNTDAPSYSILQWLLHKQIFEIFGAIEDSFSRPCLDISEIPEY